MRIAVSNIAWDIVEDEAIAVLLQRHGVAAIDVAPSKYFPDPKAASSGDIHRVRDWWHRRGIEITGMQALMFGTVGLNLFGPTTTRDAMLQHLTAICRIGAGLAAPRLVFGSPKSRDRGSLDPQQAIERAADFFTRLGDIAAAHGVMICLEPNPACYGANFMTTTEEAAEVVTRVGHPAIRLQLDSGAMTINGEDTRTTVTRYAGLTGHIHASEPNLLPLGDGQADLSTLCSVLPGLLEDPLICVEMLATDNEAHTVSIDRALRALIGHAGAAQGRRWP